MSHDIPITTFTINTWEDGDEEDLRSRKKIRAETESLSLPGVTGQQTPVNGLTYDTPVSKMRMQMEHLLPKQKDWSNHHQSEIWQTNLRLLPPPQVSREPQEGTRSR